MELHIEVAGTTAATETAALRDWLHEARLSKVTGLEQARRPPSAGEMGPEWLPLLTVVLAAPAVVELVRSIHEWIRASRPGVTITLKNGERSVTIDARNMPAMDELAEAAKRLADA